MHLANNEHKFYFKEKGVISNQWFEGDFSVKCVLTIEEQVRVGVLVDRYNGGSRTLDPNRALMNRSIAEMEVRIIYDNDNKPLCPTWWSENGFGRTLIDSNILYSVFSKAMEGEKKWMKDLEKEADKSEKEVDKSEKIRAKRKEKEKESN
jgi:hypothetical protein